MKTRHLLTAAILAGPLLASPLYAADEKITFNDHVLPVFKNACLNCHNPDKKKAGLDLSTFQATLMGSDSGKVVESGNAGNSLLLKTIKHTEEPKMPPKGDKLTDGDIALVEKWIAGQLLEAAGSKAVAPTNNVQLTVISLDRPAGPPPMPATDLPLEPLVRTKANNALVAMAASPWAPLVAVGGQKQIVLYNTETLQALGILPFPEGFPSVVRFSKNGQLLLTGGGLGGKSGKVVLWKVENGERVGQIGDEFDQVLGADLSPDHGFVALGGPTKVLKIYSTKDGKLVETIKKHTDWITAVAFSPDGKYLASADRNGGIEVWEGSSGKPYISLPGHKAMVTGLSFMPGVLASASEDGKITLWDVKEGKELRSWNAHPGGVSSVDFTTDGRLVSCGRDRLAKAWDQTGKVLLTSQPLSDIALRAVLSNERVIAGDWAGMIRVFNLADGKPLGELTANPPMIAEGLAATEQRLKDLDAQTKAAQAGLAAADAKLKAAVAELQQKRAAELKAMEEAVSKAKADFTAAQEKVGPIEQQLAASREAVTRLVEARDAKPEGERAAAQKAVEAQQAKVKEDEGRVQKAKAELTKVTPALQKKIADSEAALTAARNAPTKLQPTPESVAAYQAAVKQAEKDEAEYAQLLAARDKLKSGTPPYAAADQKLAAKRAVLLQAKAKRDAAKVASSSAPVEQEFAKAQAALAQVQAQIPLAQAELARWQRAQAFMGVHRANESLAELKAKHDGLVAAAKEAFAPADKAKSDLAAAEKVAATADNVVKEKEAAAAKLRTDLAAARKAVTNAESAVAAAEARAKAAAQAAEALKATASTQTPPATLATEEKATAEVKAPAPAPAPAVPAVVSTEVPNAKAALAKAHQALKNLEGKAAEADKLVEAARKLAESETQKVAALRSTVTATVAEAQNAKTKAEQEAAAAGQALEAAKAQADRVRSEYETRYRAQQSAPAKPLAAQ